MLNAIREKKALTDEIKAGLMQAVKDFKATWQERGFNPQPDPPVDREGTHGATAAAGHNQE